MFWYQVHELYFILNKKLTYCHSVFWIRPLKFLHYELAEHTHIFGNKHQSCFGFVLTCRAINHWRLVKDEKRRLASQAGVKFRISFCSYLWHSFLLFHGCWFPWPVWICRSINYIKRQWATGFRCEVISNLGIMQSVEILAIWALSPSHGSPLLNNTVG